MSGRMDPQTQEGDNELFGAVKSLGWQVNQLNSIGQIMLAKLVGPNIIIFIPIFISRLFHSLKIAILSLIYDFILRKSSTKPACYDDIPQPRNIVTCSSSSSQPDFPCVCLCSYACSSNFFHHTEPVGYGDPLFAVLPSFHEIK